MFFTWSFDDFSIMIYTVHFQNTLFVFGVCYLLFLFSNFDFKIRTVVCFLFVGYLKATICCVAPTNCWKTVNKLNSLDTCFYKASSPKSDLLIFGVACYCANVTKNRIVGRIVAKAVWGNWRQNFKFPQFDVWLFNYLFSTLRSCTSLVIVK